MNKYLLTFIISLLFYSCIPDQTPKSEVVFFETEEKHFSPYINQKVAPSTPNLTLDKSILNNDYPIEIALYNDGKWYYQLPNLGNGFGTWKYEEGRIKLYAKRTLFDMHIELKAISESARKTAIEFSDRFGPRFLPMENKNIEF